MHPCLVLRVNVVLVDGVLVGEGALHLPDVVVYLLPAVFIHGAAQRPDQAELEPQLGHAGVVFCIVGVALKQRKELGYYMGWGYILGIQLSLSKHEIY